MLTVKQYCEQYPITNQIEELIDGEVVKFPSPKFIHSATVMNLFPILAPYDREKKLGTFCFGLAAFILDDYNFPIADAIFIRNDNANCWIGEEDYWHGAPDLCVEVLADTHPNHDRITKFALYEKHGVGELWLVDPIEQTIEVYVLHDARFRLQGTYAIADSFSATVLPALTVHVKDIFET